jgi:hypothetical protein
MIASRTFATFLVVVPVEGFCRHLAEFEAEFDANPFLLHIHFSRSV